MRTPSLKLSALTLLALVAGSSAVRAEIVTTLVVPEQPVRAGAWIAVDIAYLNRGTAPESIRHDATVPTTFVLDGRSWPVELVASRGSETVVGPDGFILHTYLVALPQSGSGRGTLCVNRAGAAVLHGAIEVLAPGRVSAPGPATAADAATRTLRVDEADTQVLGRTFAGRLNIHNPIYFVYGGGEQHAAKFQLSFKYRATTFREDAERGTLSTLQLGYTQRSLWDLDSDSSPFYDTSYMPEVFWEWYRLPQTGETNRGSLLGFQTGLHHESNGREGDDSRSVNSAFVRAVFTFGPHDGWNLKLMPEAWINGSLDENENLDDYRGHTKLVGVFGKADSVALQVSLSPGKRFDRLTAQFDLTVPVRVRLHDLSVFLHAQYFNGYGESLRSYDQKSDALRVGISLSR